LSTPLPPRLEATWARLLDELHRLGPVLVAFSGGVDSTLLLAAAVQVEGSGARAALCLGPLTPPWEKERARRVAASLGVRLDELEAGELDDPDILVNGPQRCYFCKRRRLLLLSRLARDWGLKSVVEGSQLDDAQDYRPGSRAVAELGVHSPLARAGLDKATVRALSRALGLETAGLPSGACLATRIPTGTPLSVPALARVGLAEQALRELLPGQLRLRDDFPRARLELEPQSLALAVAEPLRGCLLERLKALGYAKICLDLEGYRPSGQDLAQAAPATP
jgi:uncharacterized protein